MADIRERFDKIDGPAGRARGTMPPARGKAEETGVVETVKEKVQDVAAGASALASRATETAQEAASVVAEKAGDFSEEVTRLIRRYPMQALLVGLGVGFLMGQITTRRS